VRFWDELPGLVELPELDELPDPAAAAEAEGGAVDLLVSPVDIGISRRELAC